MEPTHRNSHHLEDRDKKLLRDMERWRIKQSPYWCFDRVICVVGWGGFGIFTAIMSVSLGDSQGYAAAAICGVIVLVSLGIEQAL